MFMLITFYSITFATSTVDAYPELKNAAVEIIENLIMVKNLSAGFASLLILFVATYRVPLFCTRLRKTKKDLSSTTRNPYDTTQNS